MQLADLFREMLDKAILECWQRKWTMTLLGVRRPPLRCRLFFEKETAAILGLLDVDWTHGAVWNWVHRLADSVGDLPLAQPTQVAVDETAVQING